MRFWHVVAAVVCTLAFAGCSMGGGGAEGPDTSKFDKKCANHPEYKMCKSGTTP